MGKTIAELLVSLGLALFWWWSFAESCEPGADPLADDRQLHLIENDAITIQSPVDMQPFEFKKSR